MRWILLVLVCVLIVFSMIYSTNQLCDALMYASGNLAPVQSAQAQTYEEEILSLPMAQAYLRLSSAEELQEMLDSGDLDGTFFRTASGEVRFIKELLYRKLIDLAETE